MDTTSSAAPRLNELVPVAGGKLQSKLSSTFPTQGSIEWEVRVHRQEYIAAGALFEIAGRLLAHVPTFERVALEIGARRLAERHRTTAR